MLRLQSMAGAAFGVVMALLLLNRVAAQRHAQSGSILSESDGHLRELVIHYEPSANEIVARVYRDFLARLENDIAVHVVCPSAGAFERLRNIVGPTRCHLRPIVVGHAMTTWSRDRWVALEGTGRSPITLLAPRGEAGDEIWPARAGDKRVAEDLSAALAPRVRTRPSSFYFDGGDFLADRENVFLAPRVLQRNIQCTTKTRRDVVEALSAEIRRHVTLLNRAPDHHLAMFMVAVANHTMLVGDPRLSVPFLWSHATVQSNLPGGADLRLQTQQSFDAVAAQCAEMGYRVVRIPVVPAADGRTYLTYVNVLIDQQGSKRIVYLPEYRGVDELNDEAKRIWRGFGYEVRAVDCTDVYRHFGCLHCLVNVLRRS